MATNTRETTEVSTHFAFGRNWRHYAATIDESRIQSAVQNMQRLLRRQSLEGQSFFDIGCGSGVHSLAALRLGARRVVAIDFDPDSVATCREVLSRWSPSSNWTCQRGSVFDLPDVAEEQFDVVYSWGVLHHTGDLWTATRKAATLVKPNHGVLAIAVYLKTPLCRLWRVEKRIYSRLPWIAQLPFILGYSAVDLLRITVRGGNPVAHVRDYQQKRGMNYWHDAHDWLGGYPYESASAEEVSEFMRGLGFELRYSSGTEPFLGLTGSGCAEYLFARASAEARHR